MLHSLLPVGLPPSNGKLSGVWNKPGLQRLVDECVGVMMESLRKKSKRELGTKGLSV